MRPFILFCFLLVFCAYRPFHACAAFPVKGEAQRIVGDDMARIKKDPGSRHHKKHLSFFKVPNRNLVLFFSVLSMILGAYSFLFFNAVFSKFPSVSFEFAISELLAASGFVLGNIALDSDGIPVGIGFVGVLICSLFLVVTLGALLISAFFHHVFGW